MDSNNVIEKWANRCRLCLLDDGIKLPIFEGEGIQRQVASKIETCFPILIYVGDPLPKKICHKCLFKLDTVYDFRHKCLEANNILTNQLQNLKHINEVKQYLEKLESPNAASSKKETLPKTPLQPTATEKKTATTAIPVAPPVKILSTVKKVVSHKVGSSGENTFQKVFVADCFGDVFFSEQALEETAQGTKSVISSRGQSAPDPVTTEGLSTTNPASVNPTRDLPNRTTSVPSESEIADAQPAATIKQEPQDEYWEQETVNTEEKGEGNKEEHTVSPQLDPEPTPPSELHAESTPICDNSPKPLKHEKLDKIDVECLKCHKSFHNEKELQEHMCEYLRRWVCDHCNKTYKSRDTLHKHKKYFCPKKKSSRVCRCCKKVFESDIDLARHQKVHLKICLSLGEDTLYTCSLCRKRFASRSLLEMHKKTHSASTSSFHFFSDLHQPPPAKVLEKKFKCNFCPSSFVRNVNLQIHLKGHRAVQHHVDIPVLTEDSTTVEEDDSVPQWKKKCNCKYCGQMCEDSTALWRHMLQAHSTTQSYTCDKCGRIFNHLSAFSNHKRTHFVKMRCRACSKLYSCPKALREHELNKHNLQRATHHCRTCSEVFETRSAFLIHARMHHSDKKKSNIVPEQPEGSAEIIPCSLCSEKFPTPAALLAHIQSHVGVGVAGGSKPDVGPSGTVSTLPQEEQQQSSLKCKICFRLFSNKGGLQRHIKIHATGKHVFYPCKMCGKKFVTEAMYKAHAASHVVSQSFHCMHCNKIFFKEEMFQSHLCEGTEKKACLKCGVLLTEEQHLTHDCVGLPPSQMVVKCGTCPLVFSNMKARNSHMRIHTNKQITLFHSSLPLQNPRLCIRMSNGLYKCSICGKITTTQQGAAAHSRWHTNPQVPKPYKCPFCNRRYTSETGLYTHIATEHPDLPG
ncbi:zinc finger protein 665-like [Periplaneta americana]|uniref:zinc finger protein 665-like n=1 Tax=Periplaneta americana TaxID=6978 RepID=UPI0037E82760